MDVAGLSTSNATAGIMASVDDASTSRAGTVTNDVRNGITSGNNGSQSEDNNKRMKVIFVCI